MLSSLSVRCIEAPPNTWGNTNKPVPRVLPFIFPESAQLMSEYHYFWDILQNVFSGTRYEHLYVHGVPTPDHIQHKEAMCWWVQTIVQYQPTQGRNGMQRAFIQQWTAALQVQSGNPEHAEVATEALSRLPTLNDELDLVNAIWEIICKQAPKSIHQEEMTLLYAYHGPMLPALVLSQDVALPVSAIDE
jgi:hypothetical protein